jgi:hypothetical protein
VNEIVELIFHGLTKRLYEIVGSVATRAVRLM